MKAAAKSKPLKWEVCSRGRLFQTFYKKPTKKQIIEKYIEYLLISNPDPNIRTLINASNFSLKKNNPNSQYQYIVSAFYRRDPIFISYISISAKL
jgi:hypothetical protein